ncbi:MAG: hypothetical protein Q7S16_03065 [bacterium]|nr:hypothetical protein [bacterium]
MGDKSVVRDHGKVVAVDITKSDGSVLRREAHTGVSGGVVTGELIQETKDGVCREAHVDFFGNVVTGERISEV